MKLINPVNMYIRLNMTKQLVNKVIGDFLILTILI